MGKIKDITKELAEKALSENGLIYLAEIQAKVAEEFSEFDSKIQKRYTTKIRKGILAYDSSINIENEEENDELESSSIINSDSLNKEYVKTLMSIKRYSAEEEKEKIALYRDPTISDFKKKALRREIVEHYMYISCQIAMRYINAYPDSDLINEGFFGIVKALDRYDASRGIRFSTYAVSWIKQTIWSYISQDHVIRLPYHLTNDQNKIEIAQQKIYINTGKQATLEQLREETGMAIKRIKNALYYSSQTASLDEVVLNTDNVLSDFIADPSDTVSEFETRMVSGYISDFFDDMSEVEKFIFMEHYGYNKEGICRTFGEIGAMVGKVYKDKDGSPKQLSRERVRQIYVAKMSTLRNSDKATLLKDFWSENI